MQAVGGSSSAGGQPHLQTLINSVSIKITRRLHVTNKDRSVWLI